MLAYPLMHAAGKWSYSAMQSAKSLLNMSGQIGILVLQLEH